MTAPTFVSSATGGWDTTRNSKTTPNISVQSGDVLVAVTMDEDNTSTTTVSGGSLTWTRQQFVAVASFNAPSIWSATASSTTSFTVNSSNCYGLECYVFRGSGGVGASSQANVDGAAPSLALTTTQADSAIVVLSCDWNAVDGASRTWRTVNSITPTSGNGLERNYFRDGAGYTTYSAYWSNAGSVASKTVGLSAPAGQKYSIVALEVLGTLSGGITGKSHVDGIALSGISAIDGIAQSGLSGINRVLDRVRAIGAGWKRHSDGRLLIPAYPNNMALS